MRTIFARDSFAGSCQTDYDEWDDPCYKASAVAQGSRRLSDFKIHWYIYPANKRIRGINGRR